MEVEHKVPLNHSVNITPFKFKHLPQLLEMLESQKYAGISDITMKTLPKVGFIATMNGQPIAAGFLRRVEPCFAQLDTLASNAYFGSNIRHLSSVVDALLNEAKRLKLKGIISLTGDKGTLERAKSLGFHVVDQTVIALSLTPGDV